MPIATRSATSWFDGKQRVDVPAGSPVRVIENIAVALAGNDHMQGLVIGRMKSLQAQGQPPIVIALRRRVRVLPKSALVEVSANGR